MKFIDTKLSGVYIVEPQLIEDIRGAFARTWCTNEFAALGLSPAFVQCSISYNHKRGTLRGMHLQAAPYEEAKLVRCTRGSIYDVVVDLRSESATFRQWISVELSATNRLALYIPAGCAHGFQTLEDETEVFYQISEFYHPASQVGLRWDDPALAIEWPDAHVRVISERDSSFPFLDVLSAQGVIEQWHKDKGTIGTI